MLDKPALIKPQLLKRFGNILGIRQLGQPKDGQVELKAEGPDQIIFPEQAQLEAGLSEQSAKLRLEGKNFCKSISRQRAARDQKLTDHLLPPDKNGAARKPPHP
jgi:hypothetical protein